MDDRSKCDAPRGRVPRATWVLPLLVAVLVALSLLIEQEPLVEYDLSHDDDAGAWRAKGTVVFRRGLTLQLRSYGRLFSLATKSVPYAISIPSVREEREHGGVVIEGSEVETAAVRSARQGPGQWELHWCTLLAAWLLMTLALGCFWWLVRLCLRRSREARMAAARATGVACSHRTGD